MDPRPTNYLRQNIVFSYPEIIRVSFSLFLYFSFFDIFNFYKNYFIVINFFFFHENKFYFFMFRNVRCSGFYRRPAGSGLLDMDEHDYFSSI